MSDRDCTTCAHQNTGENYPPCCECFNHGKWEPKDPEPTIEKSCDTCKHKGERDVCIGCLVNSPDGWEPKETEPTIADSGEASEVKRCKDCVNYDTDMFGAKCKAFNEADCGHPKYHTKEPTIADSGERREFESGAVRDMQEGKGRCDLMPLDIVERFMCGPGSKSRVLHFIERFRLSGDVNNVACAMEQFCMVCGWSKAEAMMELSKHFAAGAEKYGVDNWRKGLPEWSYMSSAVRHYIKWVDGWTDEPHDRAVLWNLICLWWTHENITKAAEEIERRD